MGDLHNLVRALESGRGPRPRTPSRRALRESSHAPQTFLRATPTLLWDHGTHEARRDQMGRNGRARVAMLLDNRRYQVRDQVNVIQSFCQAM